MLLQKPKNYGIGSKPLPPQGWHLRILFKPNQVPFITPNLIIACLLYSLQVGKYLQLAGNIGESIDW